MTGHPELLHGQLKRTFARIAGVNIALLGGAALTGWLLRIEALKCIVPGATPMKPNMAVGLLLCGTALALLSGKKLAKPTRICTAVMAATVILVAALTLGEYFFDWSLGIGQWLIEGGWAAQGSSLPSRVSPATAFCFVLVGSALVTASRLKQTRLQLVLTAGLSAALTTIGTIALAGFLLEMLFGPRWNYMGMNLSGVLGAVGFMFLGGGLLALLQSKSGMTWSLDGLITGGFAIGFALLALVMALTFNFTLKLYRAAAEVSQARQILTKIEEVEAGMSDLESEQRGYIITGNEGLLEGSEVKDSEVRDCVGKLQKLVADNSHQQPRIRQLATLVAQRISWANQTIEVRKVRGFSAAQEMMDSGTGVLLLAESRGLVKEIKSEETAKLRERQRQSELASQTAFQMLPLGVLLCFTILSLGLFFLNSGMGERTRAEHSLRQSEESMRSILESALDCVITMDHQGRVMEFNPAAETTFGYRRDEAVGQLLSDLIIPPPLRERHRKGLSRYLSTGEAAVLGKRLELSAVRRDGSEFPVELALTRIGSQVPPIFTGFIRDITERKRSEDALKQAEEKYRSIFENAAEGIFQTTPDGKYLSVNPALARMYGYGAPEELMTSVSDIGPLVYVNPERRMEFKQMIAERGFVERFEYEVYRKDRSRVWLSENARAVRDASGAVIFYEGAVQDITERKRAEDAVRQAEEKYRNIVENAVEGVFQTTPDGKFITANLALARILGFDSVEELVDGRTDIAHESYVNAANRDEFKRLLEENGFVLNFELEAYRKDGSRIWLSENVRAVRDGKGTVLYYEGTAEDITKRKRVEDALRASEAHLQTVVENLDEGVVVSDLKGDLLHWNRAALKIHGIADLSEGRRGLTELADTFELSDMDGKPLTVNEWPLSRILRGENLRDLELRVRNLKAGWQRVFNYGGTLVQGADNRSLMAIVTISDITQRKHAEERLFEQADIINRAQDAIIIRNFEDENITFWNKGAERVYGWSAKEALGKPMGELAIVDANEREAPLQLLTSSGEFRGEIKQVGKDGRQIIVDCRASVIQNADGQSRSVLLINTDVTGQKKLETQLLRSQRLESIGTLASGVAHDLNNILTPILMCAHTLRGDPDDHDRQSAISLIEESAQRGAGVVKQVLTFARGIEGERVLMKPNHLLEEMIDIARKTFPKSIQLTGRYPENLWSIQGDPTQLHQVLLNLSVNARDAMPSGGSLTLAAENFMVDEHYAAMTPDAKVGPYVLLRVCDTGSGMPRATIEKIFDPFFTTKELGKGTGLGLSTALGIVKSHGGFISVYSESGKGTTFKLFLPAVMGNEDLQDSKTAMAPTDGKGQQILIVDDEPNILQVTKMIFEKHNYRVIAANDGTEALALFAQQMHSIEGVITDIAMPYMDGVALVRTLKKMKSDLAIIASTGQDDQPRLLELQSLGVKDFLTKPYSAEKLLTTLKGSLEIQSAL
jgi:PAS domain S-box-containing protein